MPLSPVSSPPTPDPAPGTSEPEPTPGASTTRIGGDGSTNSPAPSTSAPPKPDDKKLQSAKKKLFNQCMANNKELPVAKRTPYCKAVVDDAVNNPNDVD